MSHSPPFLIRSVGLLSALLVLFVLGGCLAPPDYRKPETQAPGDWTSWRSSPELLDARIVSDEAPPPAWWRLYQDPVLDALVQRALAASPDLRTAALRVAQARVQRQVTAGQSLPELSVGGTVARQRQSEDGASTRLVNALDIPNQDALITFLSDPFTLYQAGFDASWELDLWGRVSRSIEAAEADLRVQQALHELAGLSIVTDLVRSYFELREGQQERAIAEQDLQATEELLQLVSARVEAGVTAEAELSRQRAQRAAARAQLPPLLAREGVAINQILTLLGERPGELNDTLRPREQLPGGALPDLSLGLPSEVALRRPDVRAAEARLQRATAGIGIARADLYPSIRLGGRIGLESILAGDLLDWGSRTWWIGPSVVLPLFDGNRRRGTVALRELEQQQAAIAYQQAVLTAWREIDDALSGYEAERRQRRELEERARNAADVHALARARYEGGLVDYIEVLEAQRRWLQARRELAVAETRTRTRFARINKAIGNAPMPDSAL